MNAPPKRPTLLEVRDRMRARNEAHAKAEGLTVHVRPGPVPVADLASTIARDNAARAARSELDEQRDYARIEILGASKSLEAALPDARQDAPELAEFFDTLATYNAAVAEYLKGEESPAAPAARSAAIVAMRAAVESLERARGR
jgi:hypothetical protein